MATTPAVIPNALPTEAPAPKWHDVKVVKRRTYQCARVEGVPPEEFGIARNARSIRDAGYCFHEVMQREDDLIADGFDADQVRRLPTYNLNDTIEGQARDTVDEGETGQGDEGINKANRQIKITEHYVRMDYVGDGKPCLYCVTTAGDEGEVLRRDGKPAIEKVDAMPFAAMTPVIVTHRFFGRSVADLVMDIQRIKTVLLRALLDNIYMANNPRPVIGENEANENTIDDLLVSRHGAPIRTKVATAVQWQEVPTIGDHVYPALQYLDATREWRTGVSRQGQGVDPNALQNQVATIANQMFNAAQAKVKLIARIFAETGVRDLFSLLHMTIRKNGSQAQTVRLRNQWVNVDPREWKNRSDMTINVGLGTGGKSEQLTHMLTILGLQEKALAAGLTNLVDAEKLKNSADEVCKLVGLKDADRFFKDPTDPDNPPPQPRMDPKLLELQAKNEIEKTQMQADIAFNRDKLQGEIALAQQKFAHERDLAERQFQLDARIKMLEAKIKREQHQMQMQATQMKVEAQRETTAMGLVADRERHEMGLIQSDEKHKQGMEATEAKAKAAKKNAGKK